MLVRRNLHPSAPNDMCLVFDIRSFHCVLLIILPFIHKIAKTQPGSKKWSTLVHFAEEQMGCTYFVSRKGVLYENILNVIIEFMDMNPSIIYDYWIQYLDRSSQHMREVDYIQLCNYIQKGIRMIRSLCDYRNGKEVHVFRLKRRLMMVEYRHRSWFERLTECLRRTRRQLIHTFFW